MASTFSDRYKLELMETGANASTWGDVTNSNLETIDAFTMGYLSKSVAGSADVTLTTANRDPSAESSNKVIEFTGALTGNIKVFVPAVENEYIFFNNTSGSFSLTVAPTGHAANGAVISQGAHTIQYCKGDRVVDIFAGSLSNLKALTKIDIGNNIHLYANGVVAATTFSGDGSGLSGVGEFASGTKVAFVQSSAPTGFTIDTTAALTESALQIVTGSGGGTGGSDTFTTVLSGSKSATNASVPISVSGVSVDTSSLTIGATTLSTPTIASHTHSAPLGTAGGSPRSRKPVGFNGYGKGAGSFSNSMDSEGGGGSHTHPISGSGALGGSIANQPVSQAIPAMELKYVDAIIASAD
jgi:hypothetical protein|tara:strand:- start:1862 stop:2926 length:1065 start_codon:yes stop_codon:yes gene_type:complete